MGRRTGLKSQEKFLDYARYRFSNLMNNSLVFFPFAEGARRSALMTLRHDFDLHYKYTGKV